LPDHVGAPRRVAKERRATRGQALLPPSCAASAPGSGRDDHRHVRVRRPFPPGRSREAPRRCRRVLRVRGELVPPLPSAGGLLEPRASADAPAPLVLGDRGAVLSGVAVAPRPCLEVLAPVAREARRRNPLRGRVLGAPHGGAVPHWGRPVARVLRHRHAFERSAHRRGHGGPASPPAAAGEGPTTGARRPGPPPAPPPAPPPPVPRPP